MATAQAYQAYAQTNKGTLVPGQTISVNKYTVQVERYLSQGGFAHVYLVRTPAPVYGTTHHVLKRIAVANEVMLSEVKTEVDVMRVLKGHPNIVHLIDAAWHRMPNGTYEVFILMEYCPGGGIIDMMNRRLRERLTEAEILQIFVDVCEGVAFMHNSRPPLLHRDLKVENILQSSPTSYKLCDFGSATTVSRPPTNTQEIRALEADLGRHTTMQYRAPEMIDLYSKRPIDEKSDVWALGVLLYKLCYYTTPFEEHGSLAILNVQYRIPPYPVYSSQMNMLIASMLREHGTQRPAVFEVLNHVHYLRGTKSQFTYNIPTAQPLAAKQSIPKPSSSASQAPSLYAALPAVPNGSRNGHSPTPPSTNAGAQAREKVLEAIAPMRRGRPDNLRETGSSSSRHPSPQTTSTGIPPNTAPAGSSKNSNWLDNEEAAWNAMSAQAKARDRANALFDEAWKVSGSEAKKADEPSRNSGFENDFADKLWRAPNPNSNLPTPPPKSSGTPALLLKPGGQSIKPLSHTGSEALRLGSNREKDAFEGLGLMTSIGKPAPTLAEARKLRTGLAIMSTSHQQQKNTYTPPSSDNLVKPSGSSSGAFSARPTPSPRPSYLSPTNVQANSISPAPSPGLPTGSSWQSQSRSTSGLVSPPNSGTQPDGTPIEARFPSLEEIDAQFSAPSLYPSSTRLSERSQFKPSPSPTAPQLPPRPKPSMSEDYIQSKPSSSSNPPQLPPRSRIIEDSGRSTQPLQVTKEPSSMESLQKKFDVQRSKNWDSASFHPESRDNASLNPPAASRPKPSSMTMKYALDGLPSTSSSADTGSTSNRTGGGEDKYSRSPKPPPKDWLTGDDELHSTPVKQQNTRGSAILRETPAKRASVIIQDFKFQSPVAAQHDTTPIMKSQELPAPPEDSPTVSRFTKNFPPIPIDTVSANQAGNEGLTDNWSPIVARSSPPRLPPKTQTQPQQKEVEPASSADEDGPEDLGGLSAQPPRKSVASLRKKKGRQSSVHDLVDLWGGGVANNKSKDAPITPTEEKVKFPSVMDKAASTTTTSKPRPTSLMPPLSGGSGSKFAFGGGNISPVQRAPSPISPSLASFEAPKEATSPTPSTKARSRPQSMFLFPSKSTDGTKPLSSPLLSPPTEEEDVPKLPKRRTSISNMVQRYEAIGGTVTTPQQVTPGLRKVSAKSSFPASTQAGDSAPTRVKVFPISNKVTGSNAGMGSGVSSEVVKPSAIPNIPKGDYKPSRTTVEPLKVRTTKISMPGGGGGGSGPTEVKKGFDVLSGTTTTATPISSSTSVTSGLSSSRPGLGHAKEGSAQVGLGFPKRKPTLPDENSKDTSSIAFPKRKPTIHAAESAENMINSSSSSRTNNTVNYSNALPTDEEVSSSPERPYQGVGKLIDQWQRKSEEAAAKGGPGGGGMAKRAGLINRV